ncbi:hypothetical protein HYW32_04325 [Candidatus Berkelbacteria bacterium]|nr:hypothetical protein [Candidatus Berkelbacteria bacterium]
MSKEHGEQQEYSQTELLSFYNEIKNRIIRLQNKLNDNQIEDFLEACSEFRVKLAQNFPEYHQSAAFHGFALSTPIEGSLRVKDVGNNEIENFIAKLEASYQNQQ